MRGITTSRNCKANASGGQLDRGTQPIWQCPCSTRAIVKIAFAALVLLLSCAPVAAQPVPPAAAEQDSGQQTRGKTARGDVLADTPDVDTQVEQLRHALVRLPIAAGLASLLAMRPRRRGTPPRQAPVIQTQIILAIVGAVVMLVVGSS